MRAAALPIAQVPHLTRLYSHYLTEFSRVLPYYACPPLSRDWMKTKPEYAAERRAAVASVLEAQNRAWGAGEAAQRNLARFRAGASAVVTGQQVALFGGPLYAILKAVTAIKRAEEATAAGVDTVPIFWLATEDHDLAEVAFANVPAASHLNRVTVLPEAKEGAPVGSIRFDDEIRTAVRTAAELLGDSEVTAWLREAYVPGATFGDAFARLFARMFAAHGLILLDPAASELHRVAQPLYVQAAERAAELTEALLERNRQLEAGGYHAQVKVTNTSTLLFVAEDGVRRPVQRINSHFSSGEKKWRADELVAKISDAPQSITPNALFRPVVQDYLLPTIAYVGGPAEVAYFAQSAVVYEKLLGSVTPILPRISATLIEPGVARKLETYRLVPAMAFHGEELLTRTLATHALPPELSAKFVAARETLDATLASLDTGLEKLDPTLREAAERSGVKMRYQLQRLEQRAALAQQRRQDDIARHAHEIATALYPHKNLQERGVAGAYFLARYGIQLIAAIKAEGDPASADHLLLYL